jgi:hypothetical protein
MQAQGTRDEQLFLFSMSGVRKTTFDGADGLTGLVVMKTHAFGTTLGVDYIDIVALADGIVWTLRLARSAVDADLGNVGRHDLSLPLVSWE